MPSLTAKQTEFLARAKQAGISADLFGDHVPEIRYQPKPDSQKPTIAYIHTGGTLAMVPSRAGQNVLSFEGAIDLEQTLAVCQNVARVHDRYNIMGIYLSNIDSKEVTPALWTSLAVTIKTIYGEIDGAVIGHGTNTLEYSTASIAYAFRDLAIPIVFTASQIPVIGFPGSDGLGNLTGAMEIAAISELAEVVAYTHGEIFRGTRVTKKNDKRLDVFESRIVGPIGYFTAAGVELLPGARRRHSRRKHELIFQPRFNPSVIAVRLTPGANVETINEIVRAKKDVGLILETYGAGAVPRQMVAPLHEHSQRGFPIFVTSTCAESGTSSGMIGHDEDARAAMNAGIMNARDMTTSAATVKLMSIMAEYLVNKGKTPQEILPIVNSEMTGKSYAGEITIGASRPDF